MKFLGLFCLYICLSALPALASEDFSDAEFEAQLKALTGGASSTKLAPKQQEELFDFGDDVFAQKDDIANPLPPLSKAPPPPASSSASSNARSDNNLKITKDMSLSDALEKQSTSPKSGLPIPDVSGTWVDKLSKAIPEAIGGAKDSSQNIDEYDDEYDDYPPQTGDANKNLINLVDKSRRSSKRSNASVFDISGIMLRMNENQAEKAMLSRGFKKTSQKYDIPNFIQWRNEEKCRQNGVIGYERIMNCVVELAKKDNHQFVDTVKFVKYSTQEEVQIWLTSNFTHNKIYRIIYKTTSGKVVGSGAKAAYLRNIRIYDFWKKINQKYGSPDDKDDILWGLGGNKPYMKAKTGFLLLEDPMLRELDYTRMSREDQKFMNTNLYSF